MTERADEKFFEAWPNFDPTFWGEKSDEDSWLKRLHVEADSTLMNWESCRRRRFPRRRT